MMTIVRNFTRQGKWDHPQQIKFEVQHDELLESMKLWQLDNQGEGIDIC